MTAAAGGAEQKSYEIGYGRPPTDHQFQKGKSGNSRGRPRRPAEPAQRNSSIQELILEEGYRPVAVREGGKSIEMSMVQAALRNMGATAMKGGRLAREYVTLIQAAEKQTVQDKLTSFASMLDEKYRRAKMIEDAVRNGHDVPDLVPHPDDFIVDLNAGVVRIVGPRDERDKVSWDAMQAQRQEALEEIADYRKEMQGKPGPHVIAEGEIHIQTWRADRIQSLFPDQATRRSPSFALNAWPPIDEDGNILLPRYKPAKPAKLS
jgi:hypothetical protein